MAVSMRHTKLKAEEAALLAGEIKKPSWQSKNEGIHERVSFEDTIWGFDLAGGLFYKTPLRVTSVKPDSRAEKAGIRPGDKLKRINDIDTSTLTIQEAHDIIVESGIHLRIAVTAPEDEEDAYFCYEDPLNTNGYDSDEERRRLEEAARKRKYHAKVSSFWSLQWPWVSRKRLIYRESNCFMVNSKYEEGRREKYPLLPTLRYTDDIVHFEDEDTKKVPSLYEIKERTRESRERSMNKDTASTDNEKPIQQKEDPNITGNQNIPNVNENKEVKNENPNTNTDKPKDSISAVANDETNLIDPLSPIPESMEESSLDFNRDVNGNDQMENDDEMIDTDIVNDSEIKDDVVENDEEMIDSDVTKDSEINDEVVDNGNEIENPDEVEYDKEDNLEMNGDITEDAVINEVLGKANDNLSKNEEDNILDSILGDEGQNLDNSEVNNVR